MKTADTTHVRRVAANPLFVPGAKLPCELLVDLWGEAADSDEFDALADELARDLEGEGEMRPTPDEIAAGCAEVQAEWSPGERRKRAGLMTRPEPYEIPAVRGGSDAGPTDAELMRDFLQTDDFDPSGLPRVVVPHNSKNFRPKRKGAKR